MLKSKRRMRVIAPREKEPARIYSPSCAAAATSAFQGEKWSKHDDSNKTGEIEIGAPISLARYFANRHLKKQQISCIASSYLCMKNVGDYRPDWRQ